MTLRKKTLLAAMIGILFSVAVLFGLSKIYLTRNYLALEKTLIHTNMERLVSAVTEKFDALNTAAGDWSLWDDAYFFVLHPNDEFVQRNLGPATYTELGVNLIVFCDREGKVIYGQGFDLQQGKVVQLSDALLQRLLTIGNTGQDLVEEDGMIKGLIYVDGGPMIVASRWVLPNSGQGQPAGLIIMGRYVDEELVQGFSALTRLSIHMQYVHDPNLSPELQIIRDALMESNSYWVEPISDRIVAGYVLFHDVYNAPLLIARVDMTRDIIQQGRRTIDLYMIWFTILAFLFTGGVLWVLERLVLKRLTVLSRDVESIGVRGDIAGRLTFSGNDELARLAQTINESLDALERAQFESLINEQKLSTILENSPNPVFVMDAEGDFIEANQAALDYFEVSASELVGLNYWAIFKHHCGKSMESGFSLLPLSYELDYTAKSGVKTLLLNIIPFASQDEERFYAIGQDITERKRMEERLIHANTHDNLTGLYNRWYYEEKLLSLSASEDTVAIILMDINGLKLVNDGFGMEEGDRLILHTAQLIKGVADRLEAMVCRTGGDEFAVLIPGGDREMLDRMEAGIRWEVERFNSERSAIPLSLSMGSYLCDFSKHTVEEAIKAADDAMHREKLHQDQSTRSTVVKTLMTALEARDYITEGHADRLQDIVQMLAGNLGLSHARIGDLRLLGQFHDIGKVGIPDRILFKNGPLTPEEKLEMQRHSEIGYRIALASPDLAPIAEWILKHHEWWNGRGYPLGLKGEEIPLECRILAIADAYDAMVSDRPYRRALSRQEALEELRRCSGEQFDPDLVERFVGLIEAVL